MLVGMAGVGQCLYGFVDASAGIERAFQEVVVEFEPERLQVQVLLASQVRNSKAADIVDVVDIFVPVYGLAGAGLDGGASQNIVGDIEDEITFVEQGCKIGVVQLFSQ